ncbi:Dfp1/Him1, central region-domain-containing protein [Hysterangium stoloniferum]|nr:Dfp1/Him1, central region-domain-containing protein [Hysterangium stoloniferum]
MATSVRRPLSTRQADQSHTVEKLLSPFTHNTSRQHNGFAMSKRPRSPDGDDTINQTAIKKCKTAPVLLSTMSTKAKITPNGNTLDSTQDTKDRKDKQRQKELRQHARDEFNYRYTKAFPSFVFFFDERDGGKAQAESRVLALGAVIEHFFSASVTHVITNRPQPPKNEQYDPNKENVGPNTPAPKGSVLKSPIQLKTRCMSKVTSHDHGGYDKLVRDAVQMDKKIWSVSKLESILSRLVPSNNITNKLKGDERLPPLTQLLQNERLNGTTLERDPKEKRHDYQYFSKGSYFLLVEDIKNELAPIAIMEYSAPARNSDKAPAYPVLYMDSRARSPFVKYDDKEARRQEKLEASEKLKDAEKAQHRVKIKELLKAQREEVRKLNKTLKRRASMSQLTVKTVNRLSPHDFPDEASHSGGGFNQLVASGYGPSTTGLGGNAYLAASANSVTITSTTTTSFARTIGGTARLPPNLRERLGHQVVMSRRLEANKENNEPRLRKAKSTTTMRLPAREETKKPGYCEACRVKFEDFNTHIRGSRHRKFARNEDNYIDLDYLLRRLERKPAFQEPSNPPSLTADDDDQDEPSDACLGPGDYFYDFQIDADEDDGYASDCRDNNDADSRDDEDGENLTIPRIIIDEDGS